MLAENHGLSKSVTEHTCQEFVEELDACRRIIRTVSLRDLSGTLQILVGLILAKWYDESRKKAVVKLGSHSLIAQLENLLRHSRLWYQGQLGPGQPQLLDALHEAEQLVSNEPVTVVEVAHKLWRWDLLHSDPVYRGRSFDSFVDLTFRRDLGHYATPAPVAKLMVGLLQPTMEDLIGDPGAGIGRMLIYAARHLRESELLPPADGVDQATSGSSCAADSYLPTFCEGRIFGMESSKLAATVAYLNFLMSGISPKNLFLGSGVASWSSVKNMVGDPVDKAGFRPRGLTAILLDPPMGHRVADKELLREYADQGGIFHRRDRLSKSVASELLFLNRAIDYLKPGGRLVMLLPDGILSNESMRYAREWVLRQTRLKALVSLPDDAYADYGARLKASAVALEKREYPIKESSLANESYDVYVAQIDDLGDDSDITEAAEPSLATKPSEVDRVIGEFSHQVGW